MTDDELFAVRALRDARKDPEFLAAAKALVAKYPGEAAAQLEAAFAHDRNGLEREALEHYERGHELGVPGDVKRRFYVGYGSTLRNVGRADDSVGVLGEALADDPSYPPYAAFLALSLLAAGHARAALAAMLGCALDVAVPGAFDSFERSLGHYHQELLEPTS